jgi:hypothetical protein
MFSVSSPAVGGGGSGGGPIAAGRVFGCAAAAEAAAMAPLGGALTLKRPQVDLTAVCTRYTFTVNNFDLPLLSGHLHCDEQTFLPFLKEMEEGGVRCKSQQ